MKKIAIILVAVLISALLSACAQFEVKDTSEIRLKSNLYGTEAVIYPEDEDFKTLVNICEGSIYRDIPGCPFGICEIQFVKDDETVTIYPTGDGCSKFAIDELTEEMSLVSISDDDIDKIYEIMQKYDIPTKGG